jgi:hypothetical protein
MPRPKKTQNEGVIDLKRVRYVSGELAEESENTETVPCPTFDNVETGRINVRGSVTRNLGNFNSVRVEVGVELPTLPELSEVDRVYDICSKFVEHKLKDELDNATMERSPISAEKEIATPRNRTAGRRIVPN